MSTAMTWIHVDKSAPPSTNAVSANIKHSIDTSIKHLISGQSTTVLKGCLYIRFIKKILPLVQESFKVKESKF